MTDDREAKFRAEYVVATVGDEHHVCVIHDDSPEWMRIIATFRTKARAEDYASLESDMVRDAFNDADNWGDYLKAREGDDKPAPKTLPTEPKSGIVPGDLVRRSTVMESEITAAVLDALKSTATTVTKRAIELGYERGKADHAVETNKVIKTAPEKASNSHLRPETEAAPKASLENFPAILPQVESPIPEAAPAEVKADLVPAVALDGTPQGQAVRKIIPDSEMVDAATLVPITRHQLDVFKALVELLLGTDGIVSPLEIDKVTNKKGSAGVLVQLAKKGYTRNVGPLGAPHWLITAYGAPRLIGSEPAPVPPQDAPPAVEAPPATPEPPPEEIATLDDLSAAAKFVLKAIVQLAGTQSDEAIAELAEIDQDRLPFQYKRLEELKLAHRTDGGVWFPSELGTDLASKIKGPVKISTPIVRRVQETPAPVNRNGHSVKQIGGGDKRLDVVTYLQRKGAKITREDDGTYTINGTPRSKADAVMTINSYRTQGLMPPLSEEDVW